MESETHRETENLHPAVEETAIRDLYKLQDDIIMCKSFYERHNQKLNSYGSDLEVFKLIEQ